MCFQAPGVLPDFQMPGLKIMQGVILLVDDDDSVRAYIRSALERSGFVVHEASSGASALETAAKPGPAIELLITDVNMPGMDGAALAREINQLIPAIPVLFISGLREREAAVVTSRHAFLAKPFTPKQLKEAVESLISRGDGAQSAGYR
jgi:two-component system, cell cycle sensor histidine kinase and response regulator CckA